MISSTQTPINSSLQNSFLRKPVTQQQQLQQTPLMQPQQPANYPQNQMQQQNTHPLLQEFLRLGSVEDWFLEGGYKNRILLALKSTLPNEIDWALNKLVLLSYSSPENFPLSNIPNIIEEIIDFLQDFYEKVKKDSEKNLNAVLVEDFDYFRFNNLKKEEILREERWLQIYHILRNFSFVEINVGYLVSSQKIISNLILFGLKERKNEFKFYSLDLLENIGMKLKLEQQGGNNEILQCLYEFILHSRDRGLILCSLRCLSRLILNEENEPCFSLGLELPIMNRLFQLLFVWSDEELVATVMDLLYQYTSLISNKFNQNFNGKWNVVGLFVKFLEWRVPQTNNGKIQQQPVTQQQQFHAKPQVVPQQRQLPPQTPLQQQSDEIAKKHCFQWWKANFAVEADSTVLQQEVYGQYLKHCQDTNASLLSMQDFTKLALYAFQCQLVQNRDRQVFLKGIKKISENKDQSSNNVPSAVDTSNSALSAGVSNASLNSADILITDANDTSNSEPVVNTPVVVDGIQSPWRGHDKVYKKEEITDELLWKDLLSHLDTPIDLECKWKTCKYVASSKNKLISHIKTHFPSTSSADNNNQQAKNNETVRVPHNQPQIFNQQPHMMALQDSSSIPLTSALILRNLARDKENRGLFLGFEEQLVRMLTLKRNHESVSKVLCSVLAEIGTVDK